MSPYPTTRACKIKINGVDRTTSIPVDRESAGKFGARPLVIEDVLTDQANTASFTVLDGDAMSLTGLQTVVISNVAETVRYFGGVITRLHDRSRGDGLDYDVDCEDFGWYLAHPEALIDAEYTGDSDLTIIASFMATCCPDIEVVTKVVQVLASIDYIRFEGETPDRALKRLAKMAGAEFYVDYGDAGHPKGHLRYFASGTNAAPHSLSDAPDLAASFGYKDFHKVDQVPDVNSVEVVGRNSSEIRYYAATQDSNQGALSYTQDAGDETFTDVGQQFFTWMTETADAPAVYKIVVTNADSTEVWAYLGPCLIRDTEQGNLSYTTEGADYSFTDDGQDFAPYVIDHIIVVVNDDATVSWGYLGPHVANVEVKVFKDSIGTITGWNGTNPSGKTPSTYNVLDNQSRDIIVYTDLALTVKGWNGDTSDPRGDADTPSSYVVTKAESDYGYWIRGKIVDNDLVTDIDLRQRGDQFLAEVAAGVSYTCTTWEPGLESGQDVTVVNAARSLNSSLLIKRVTTEFETGGYAVFYPEMGARVPRFADVLVGGRNIWDEEKFLPKRPGVIEQEDAGTDVQAQHDLTTYNNQAAYASRQRFRKSHSDTLGTKTATIDTEELGLIEWKGVDSGSGFALGGYIKVTQEGAAGAAYIPAKLELVLYDSSGNPMEWDFDPTVPQTEYVDGGTSRKAHLILSTYNDEDGIPYNQSSIINLRKSHSDTLGTLAETQDTEALGRIEFYGVDTNSLFVRCATIMAFQDGAAGDDTIPAKLWLWGQDNVEIQATDGTVWLRAATLVRLTGTEGVGVDSTAHPTANPKSVLFFLTKAADPTMAANTAGIYAKDVAAKAEMFAIDEDGNAAQLTPHDPETGEWIFFTRNVKTGRVLKVRMEALTKAIDELLGGGYIQDYLEEVQS